MSSKVLLPSFNAHIQPQLNEIIADLLSEANPAESFYEALKKPQWWTHRQFKDIYLDYKLELSIEDWVASANAHENEGFADQLKQQLADTIEYQWDIKLQAWSDESRYEHELEIERAAVA